MYLDPVKFQGDMNNHEKMHLFARDVIRVRNPLASDFKFKFDSIWYTIKAGQEKDWERYLVEHYVWNISQQIIGGLIEQQGTAAVRTYSQANPQVLLDPYIANRQIWDKIPRMDDAAMQAKIVKDVVVGLVEKFGEDREVAEPQQARLSQNTPLYKDLINEITRIPLDNVQPLQPELTGSGTGTPAPQTANPFPAAPQTQTMSGRGLESEVTDNGQS